MIPFVKRFLSLNNKFLYSCVRRKNIWTTRLISDFWFKFINSNKIHSKRLVYKQTLLHLINIAHFLDIFILILQFFFSFFLITTKLLYKCYFNIKQSLNPLPVLLWNMSFNLWYVAVLFNSPVPRRDYFDTERILPAIGEPCE